MLGQHPVLSICIASYNHGESLYDLITRLLSKEHDIEIICSDNASTDKTNELLTKIEHRRFKYIQNPTNIGPTANYVQVLSRACGKYALFLCDKDTFSNLDNLDIVIDHLRTANYAMGYFNLNSTATTPVVDGVHGRYRCLKAFAYLSKHPSGYFYNTRLMGSCNIGRYADLQVAGYFPFELIAADLAGMGTCVVWDIPLIQRGSETLSKQTPCSGTYSSANKNLFFSPQCRFVQFERYIRHMRTLRLNPVERWSLMLHVAEITVKHMTKEFKAIADNEYLFRYYKIDPGDCQWLRIESDVKQLLCRSIEIKGLYRFIFNRKWRRRAKCLR